MKKKFIYIITILLAILITGCNKNDIVITRKQCEPNKNQVCYYDKDNNEKCFDSDLCLYVNYNDNRLEINEALKNNLITLNELEEKYNEFKEELKNNMQISYKGKDGEEIFLAAIISIYQDDEYIYEMTPSSARYILYDNQMIAYSTALNLELITIEELMDATESIISKEKKENR